MVDVFLFPREPWILLKLSFLTLANDDGYIAAFESSPENVANHFMSEWTSSNFNVMTTSSCPWISYVWLSIFAISPLICLTYLIIAGWFSLQLAPKIRKLSSQLATRFPKLRKRINHELASFSFPKGAQSAHIVTLNDPGGLPNQARIGFTLSRESYRSANCSKRAWRSM